MKEKKKKKKKRKQKGNEKKRKNKKKRKMKKSKAVYTAALVADGWAGAENLEKQLCDGPTG